MVERISHLDMLSSYVFIIGSFLILSSSLLLTTNSSYSASLALAETATKEGAFEKPNDDPMGHDEEGLLASEIVRLRKFNSKDHYITTKDGYILNIVEATNPLIREGFLANKQNILFIHGIETSGRDFLVNSINARPKDYSHLNAGEFTEQQLEDLLKDDPARYNLVFSALNFGHHVWILNRRGTIESRGHLYYNVNSTSGPLNSVDKIQTLAKKLSEEQRTRPVKNLSTLIKYIKNSFEFSNLDSSEEAKKFWNYSLDEQAKYDIPETIDFILQQTGRDNLTIVGHSAGSALALMSMAIYKDLSRKINKALLWAPAVDLGAARMWNPLLVVAERIFQSYSGPYPSSNLLPLMSFLPGLVCESKLAQNTICQYYYSFKDGKAGGKLIIKPGFLSSSQDAVSSKEYSHMIQSFIKGSTHFYDYHNKKRNFIAYGQPEAPEYNFTNIDSKGISIWYGATDSYVSLSAVDMMISRINAPVERHFIPEKKFNHMSFKFHINVDKLVILPGLRKIEQVD